MPQNNIKKAMGVGSPIMDLLAHVPEEFLANIHGDKGGMELVELEDMNAMIGRADTEMAIAPGGSAANTIFAMARLGVACAFLGKIGEDDDGALYLELFEELGGDTSRFKKTRDHSTARCFSMITPDSERTMRTNLGAAALLDPQEISAADFKGYDHVHAEGYLLFNRDLAESVLHSAKQAGCTVSLDMGAFEVVKAAEDILPRLLRDYVDCVFANEDEAEAFCGHREYHAALDTFSDYCETAAVKLGAEGALLKRGDERAQVSATKVEKVVDTTGAGDFWAGGFLFGYLSDLPLEDCGRLGALLGGAVVEHTGADLHDDSWNRIKPHFEKALSPTA